MTLVRLLWLLDTLLRSRLGSLILLLLALWVLVWVRLRVMGPCSVAAVLGGGGGAVVRLSRDVDASPVMA